MTNFDHELYLLHGRDRNIVQAGKDLLRKIVRSTLVSSEQVEIVAKALHVLERLPKTSEELNDVSTQLTSPRRRYGEHEIYHWWEVRIEGQLIQISSGGHFYRPSTGGDSFTCMQWSASPGYEAEMEDYLYSLRIVDDAMPFEPEVAQIDLSEAGYSVAIYVEEEEIDAQEDVADDVKADFSQLELRFDESDSKFVSPCDRSDQLLEEYADVAQGQKAGQYCIGVPDTCDLCGRSFNNRKYLVDGRLKSDLMWAYMCSGCFLKRGEGIGWGQGQLFARQLDDEWLLVAGFPPDESEEDESE